MEKEKDYEEVVDSEIIETNQIVRTSENAPLAVEDIERQTLLIEERVKFMDRYMSAVYTMIRKITNDEDWTTFGDKVCMSADAALRIAHIGNLPIKTTDVIRYRSDIVDEKTGKVVGYRWSYEGYATMHGRTLKVVGHYGTREAFLGKKGGEYRDPSEINENHIMKAAHTHFKGNCVKDLLGLNNISVAKYLEITGKAGGDSNKSGNAGFSKGTQGGISPKQREDQDKLWLLLVQLAELCLVVQVDEEASRMISEPKPETVNYITKNNANPTETYAKASLKAMTTFKNKQGNIVKGHDKLRDVKQKPAYMAGKELAGMMKEYGLEVEGW